MGHRFAHLHLHTQYSLLDGAIRMADLPKAILDRGMDTVAVTDHGNMYGAVDFYKRATAAGIHHIFGSEVYVAAEDMTDRSVRSSFHLVLLARNEQGYKNLQYLVSMAHLKGFYYNPRIDRHILKDHSAGLIGLSACLSGHVAKTILTSGTEAAREIARSYKEIFEPGCYFLEVQRNGLDAQETVNEELVKMSAALDIPLVATNDCHYIDRSDALAQEVLMCIAQGRTLNDEKRMRHETDAYYIKTPEEMDEAFAHIPQAMESVGRILDMIEPVAIKLGGHELPKFEPPDGSNLEDYLRRIAKEGLEQRFDEIAAKGRSLDKDAYWKRLEYELDVIFEMGFAGYFLIVWDFIRYAKSQSIPVGPGRGSGAGSLVAYSMRITDLDPLEQGLIFERFLNPERVSMPDFDVDFCMNRRDEVLSYVVQKYGEDNVGQIITHSTLKARGLIRDVARVLGMPYADADTVAKLVPLGPKVTVSSALHDEPKLKSLYDDDELIHQLLDLALKMEGLHRHAGMHAAGVVIAEKPLWEYVPVARAQEGQVVKGITGFAKDEVEQVGLVKFDFLGLKTLTIIDEAIKRINIIRRANQKPDFVLQDIPMDDREVFEMLQRGDSAGVFQMESSGFTEMIRKLKPDRFSDLVAGIALYRPGPLQGGMVDDFIDRKHGRQKVTYLHPDLATILEETYGVIVYQEQVMQVASKLAGFSLGEADIMRRAMGKKKAELLEGQRAHFMQGAIERGVPEKTAVDIFNLMEQFAGYGFNKSHSACYALIAYQTAYLKCHYPEEYLAGILTCEKDNSDKIVEYMGVARQMGLSILPPDINESDVDFSVVVLKDDKKAIRFGLGAVKHVGEAAVQSILEARQEGPFESIFDLLQRVDTKKVNRSVLEALIKAGALDGLATDGVHRAQLLASVGQALDFAQRIAKERASGQTNLFGAIDEPSVLGRPAYPDVPPWSAMELLQFERAAVGFYISGHPLDRYQQDIKHFITHDATDVEDMMGSPWLNHRRRWAKVRMAGIITKYRERMTKSGSGMMAFFELEDLKGRVEVLVLPKVYASIPEDVLHTEEPILIQGHLRSRQQNRKQNARNDQTEEHGEQTDEEQQVHYVLYPDKIMLLSQVRMEKFHRLQISVLSSELVPNKTAKLAELFRSTPGECAVSIAVQDPTRWETILDLPSRFNVTPNDHLVSRIENLFGREVVLFL
ncbi:MAG: DNA polymerase III subunit alpha [Deltaproteobacteria bacterium]|nr:DNA polymerase III subunit alpha [Deltaproteobacteria bacterium]